MIQIVIARSIQGILSGIGIGTIFFLYPILKHLASEKYRTKFRIQEYGKELFTYETLKYLKIGLTYGFLYGFIVGTIIGPFGAINGL